MWLWSGLKSNIAALQSRPSSRSLFPSGCVLAHESPRATAKGNPWVWKYYLSIITPSSCQNVVTSDWLPCKQLSASQNVTLIALKAELRCNGWDHCGRFPRYIQSGVYNQKEPLIWIGDLRLMSVIWTNYVNQWWKCCFYELWAWQICTRFWSVMTTACLTNSKTSQMLVLFK